MRLPAKVFILALLLIPFHAIAQSCTPGNGVTCTPALNLWLLPYNYPNYNIALNQNFSILDTRIGGSGFPIVIGSTSIAALSTTTLISGLTIDGVTPTIMSYLDATSSIQNQLNSKQAAGSYITGLSGDCSASGPGVSTVICTKSNGVAFGTAAFATLGNSGSDVPQLTSGLLANSVVNWAAPSAIGTGTPAAGTFSALGDTSISGSTQCVHASSSGVLSGTGTDCGSSSAVTVGTTTITSGTPNGLLYDNGGVLGNLATANSGVLVTSSGGVPSISTTLPSGLNATNITLVAPALGTPTSGLITNLTGTCTSCVANSATLDLPLTGGTLTGALSGTSAAFSSGITTTSDGVHSGYDSLIGNTANYAVVPNTAGFMGPSLASFTGYAYQLPTTGPTTPGVLQVGAVSSNISQITNYTSTYHAQGYGGGGFTFNPGGAENVDCEGFIVPAGGLSVGHVAFDVTTGGGAGAGNNSDFGFFGATGTRLSHIGAQVLNTTGNVTAAFVGGTQFIPAGKNYVCFVTAGTTLILGGSGGSSFVPFSYISTTGSSGALPGTITPPADAPNSSTGVIAFVVYP